MRPKRVLWLISLTLAVSLLLPVAAEARGAPRSGHGSPPRIELDVALTCLGERGATAEFSVTNNGRRTLTLGEIGIEFVFDGPGDLQAGLAYSIFLIPTVLEPGETFTYTLPIPDEALPPDAWASFHARGHGLGVAWFAGYPDPVIAQLGPAVCR